jgi:hypothetical protein
LQTESSISELKFKKMKKLNIVLFALLFILTSCSKDQEEIIENENYETSEDVSNFHDLMNDAEDYYTDKIDFQLQETGQVEVRTDCPEISFTSPQGTYPNTITIDFGDGCEGPNGRVRSGMIIIDISAPIKELGATRVTTLVDFAIDQLQFEGTKSLTNTNVDDEGNITLIRELSGGMISYPNGSSASLDATHVLTQTEGGDTNQKYDDVVEITGSSYGTNRNGVEYTVTITEALVKERPCRFLVSGIKEISISGHDGVRTLNYGNGNCDPFALLTFANGTEKKVLLFRKWW